MLSNKDFFQESIVNHIYFGGTIRRFCTIIGLTFYKNNQNYIDRAIELGTRATNIINITISLMDDEIKKEVINNNVYITEYTKDIDLLTEKLFEINLQLQTDNDLKLLNEKKNVEYNNIIVEKITNLNNESLVLINDFNKFVKEIKEKLDNQELFSYLYPDYFNYMFEEISVYGRDIERINSKKNYTEFYLKEFRYYFNELLRKSSEYVRGFLDTSHQDLFDKASFYVNSFASLTEKYLKNNNDLSLYSDTERLVKEYKKFISQIIEKLLSDEVYLITPPVILDDILTNINVYLFILEYAKILN